MFRKLLLIPVSVGSMLLLSNMMCPHDIVVRVRFYVIYLVLIGLMVYWLYGLDAAIAKNELQLSIKGFVSS